MCSGVLVRLHIIPGTTFSEGGFVTSDKLPEQSNASEKPLLWLPKSQMRAGFAMVVLEKI